MKVTGVVFWRGTSRFTGDEIVAIATGLTGESLNEKTGAMVQTWVLLPDMPPMDAKRQNLDAAICGDCALRGRDGRDSVCYVAAWRTPYRVWKSFREGRYPTVTVDTFRALLEGRYIRICAYGDGAAMPFNVWSRALELTAGHVAYTHAWRKADPRWKHVAMASVESERDFIEAQLRGWRTFRVRAAREPLIESRGARLEFACPASKEMGMRTTCERCQLCRGHSSPARSVAIVAHGHNGALAAFHKSRRAAEQVLA